MLVWAGASSPHPLSTGKLFFETGDGLTVSQRPERLIKWLLPICNCACGALSVVQQASTHD